MTVFEATMMAGTILYLAAASTLAWWLDARTIRRAQRQDRVRSLLRQAYLNGLPDHDRRTSNRSPSPGGE
jgi:hypothetical protein